jgi:hypothetical protein
MGDTGKSVRLPDKNAGVILPPPVARPSRPLERFS